MQVKPFKPPFRQKPKSRGPITFTFTVDAQFAPALKSAIEDITNQVGRKLEGQHSFEREDAYTYAAVALGILRAEVSKKVTHGSAAYL